jgi:hypothetical protein
MASKAKGPDKAAAARAERKPKEKKLRFKGLNFTLPPELPETILFDFIALEGAEDDPRPLFRLIESVLGTSQMVALRNAIARSDKVTMEDIPPLIEAIFGKYGLTPGESEASPVS